MLCKHEVVGSIPSGSTRRLIPTIGFVQRQVSHLLRHLRPVMRKGTTVFQSRWDGQSQRVITRRIVAEVEDRRNSSSMRLYTPAQMRVLFEQHGLIVEQLHKSIRFDAYGPSAPRMIIVGRKARKGSKMVQRTGASRVAQSEMRTPSAAGSHR